MAVRVCGEWKVGGGRGIGGGAWCVESLEQVHGLWQKMTKTLVLVAAGVVCSRRCP